MFAIIHCRLHPILVAILIVVINIGLLTCANASSSTVMPDKAVEINKVIDVDQLTIGNVTVTGNKEFSSNTIRNLLPAVVEGQIINLQKISAEIGFANNNPALKIAVDVQPVSRSVANIVIHVNEQKTFHNMITFDNTGDAQTGQFRIGYVAIDYNWLGRGETAVLSYTRSPSNNMVNQFGFLNAITLPKTGDTLTFSGSYSNVDSGTVADYFNISGKGQALGVHYNHGLKAATSSQAGIDFGIDYKKYDNIITFSGSNLGTNIATLPLSIAYQYTATGMDSRFSSYIGFIRNLGSASSSQDVFDATRIGAVSNYTIWRQNATYLKQLKKGWLFNTQLDSQYANIPLIAGEEFGLGGSHSVRGFNEREIAGDKGVRLSTELYTPEIAKGQRLLVFVDQGKYWLNNSQAGEIPYLSIASYGIGWRFNSPDGIYISFDWAKVLKGTETTPEGGTKLHVFASQTF